MKELLSFGTIGHNHLLAAAQQAFRRAGTSGPSGSRSAYLAEGVRLFAMAWAEFPLNGPLAAEIVRLAGRTSCPGLTPRAIALARRLAQSATAEVSRKPGFLFEQGEYEGMSRFFEAEAGKEPLLPMVGQAFQFQGLLSNWEWLSAYLERVVAPVDPEVARLLSADVYLAAGWYEQAIPVLEDLVRLYGAQGWGLRLAAARAGGGDTAGALAMLGALLSEFPLHTSALLLLDSLAFPAGRSARLDGKCVVSVYSYNKERELARTLESVLASDLGVAVGDISIRVLINGSRDRSLAVAEEARVRFGGAMDVVGLPINIGAPAARNWLLDAARRDRARWIVYLDDDVLVPGDWLRGLASGVESYPEAGVWGCRVGDVRSKNLTQHGDGFLLGRENTARTGQRLVLQEPCVESLFPAFLEYRRYAASVTGCCHLFEVESLAESAGFDLLFSPSQFDDLDADLRRLGQGKPAAYLGDVHITHLRESPHFHKVSEAAALQSAMHRAILEERHAPTLDALCRIQSAFIKADLADKRIRLREAGFLPAES